MNSPVKTVATGQTFFTCKFSCNMKIKIAIADDYKIFRDGLKVGLAADDNLKVVLEADNGEDLLNALERITPDVVLMDLKMPIMDGMEATKLIRKNLIQLRF